jgi:DNA-directed RNA polymerase specialized sigma subunit
MTKQELYSIYGLSQRIGQKQRQLEELKAKASSIELSYAERVQTSQVNNSMAIVDNMIELEQLIDKDLEEMYKKRREAYSLIRTLSGTERDVMELRYIQGYKWEEIAVKLDISYRHTTRLHGQALEKLFCKK